MKIIHPFGPIYSADSKILILGTMASVKSREEGFYYGHPKNRFWRVMAELIGCNLPESKEDKRQMLLDNHIAIWDVLASCEIIGSSDSSIKNPIANDFSHILANSKVEQIFTNGKTADKIYNKLCLQHTNMQSICLPSTSPANATYSMERLLENWNVAYKSLGKD